MSKSLFDVDGNYVGEGGQGFMTQPGVDPTGGGHAKVVTEGVKTMESNVASGNGVVKVNPDLPNWNYSSRAKQTNQVQPSVVESSNGGQSVDGSTASAEKKVVIPRREDRPAAYPTKARRDADAAASVGQELTDEQKAAVQNAGATPSPLSPAEQEAEKKDIEAGKSNTLNVVQLQGEKELNPQSSNTGADNGGQSEVPKAEEAKITAESSVNTSPQEVSKDDYDAAKRRIEDSRKKGGIGEAKDKLIIFDYEHPHQPIPEKFQPEEYKPSERPKMKDLSDGYKNVFAIMEQRRRDAMDDPASKAKRAKARRAELIVAALGDLLQVAANMWGAARGATSAKLSSIAGGVKKRHATEDALALKREAQYAKDAEQLLKREETKIKQENDMAEKLYKVAEDARKYNITEKNRAGLAQQSRELQRWAQSEAQRERERQAVITQHNREVNDLNNHRYRKDEATHRGNISRANNDHATANRIRVKQTPSASKTSSSGSSPSSGSGNTITKKEGES